MSKGGPPRGEETELRLTVNFVVAGVVRNFEASGLTFRSNGNPEHPRWKVARDGEGSTIHETPSSLGNPLYAGLARMHGISY